MRHALRTATLVAAIFSALLVAPAGAAPAQRLVAQPAVGDCHTLTYDEAQKASDPDATVPCTDPHTSYTFKVVEPASAPDWSNVSALSRIVVKHCSPAWRDQLGGSMKVARRSAYTMFFFIPTKAQRDAGATWIRCDLALLGGTKLVNVPGEDNPTLGSLPLPDSVAKCRVGKKGGYAVTVCSRNHAFRATLSLKLRGTTYPGRRSAQRQALRKCRAHIDTAFYYEYPQSRSAWKLGDHYAVCLPKTTS